MKNNLRLAVPSTLALLVAGHLMAAGAAKAANAADSAEISRLLADARAEAVELKYDAAEVETFTRASHSWQSYATKIDMMKGHVNNTGKLLAKLQAAETRGSPWQQTAIKRIEPLLKELAANLETTISHLNENQAGIGLPQFKDYVKANYELATDLEALIRDFANYGEAKEKLERSAEKLETT